MKKVMILLLSLILVYSLALPCFAAEDSLTLTDVGAQPGDMVYMTVTLNESIKGDTIGIKYTYDSAVLKAVPSSSSWAGESVLEDFDRKNVGVWTSDKVTDLKGPMCVLAFQVKENAKLTSTTVSCTVVVKNGEAEVGTYAAEGMVINECTHTYGDWSAVGTALHVRTCSACGNVESASHSWDDGATSADGKYLVYTCSVCKGTKQYEIPVMPTMPTKPTEPTARPTEPSVTIPKNEETAPTYSTKPTEPATEPTEIITMPTTEPTRPTENDQPVLPNHGGNTNQGGAVNQGSSSNQGGAGNQNGSGNQSGNIEHNHSNDDHSSSGQIITETPYKDYNQGETIDAENGEDYSGHDHSSAVGFEEPPIAVPVVPGDEETEHDHEHVTTEPVVAVPARNVNPVTLAAVAGVLLLTIGAGIYFIKKKH